MVVSPNARSFDDSSSASSEILIPLYTKAKNASSTAVAPSNPSSLAIAEKMKSVSTSGMVWEKPAPRPVPVRPPSAMLKMLWRI
jgi:hypothetical protein